jgi:hypothetical protein
MSIEGFEGPGRGSLGTNYEIGRRVDFTSVLHRLERWRLQAVARELLPEDRVSTCLRRLAPRSDAVHIWLAHDKAHYSGLMVCGCLWHCPVCASKISERRGLELRQAMMQWSGEVLFLTLTVPHYFHQSLSEVLQKFTQSRHFLRDRKPWKRLARDFGLDGSIRDLEVTHGVNGWHVHSHELLFVRPGRSKSLSFWEFEILRNWRLACCDAGLGAPNRHGVRLGNGAQADRYASKWGLEQEMTKSHIKRGREGGDTPWDLLRRCASGDDSARSLFQDYARCFSGRHQLEWSKGLRDRLSMGREDTDLELASKVEEEALLLGSLSKQEWKFVVAAEKRGELLEVAATAGWSGVLSFIGSLCGR